MMCYLQFQESVPQPNNADVFLLTSPKGTVFVSQFGGYLVDDISLSLKVKALKADLVANNESFVDGIPTDHCAAIADACASAIKCIVDTCSIEAAIIVGLKALAVLMNLCPLGPAV